MPEPRWARWGWTRRTRPPSSAETATRFSRAARTRISSSWRTSGSGWSASQSRSSFFEEDTTRSRCFERAPGGLTAQELQQDLVAEEPDRAQNLLLVHARPLEPEDHRGDAEPLAIARDLVDDPRGVADDEAVARQLVEARVEGLAGGQRLVLFPAPVRLVFRSEDRLRLRDGRRGLRRHVTLLDQRRLDRRRPPELASRGPKELELALERRELGVGVHQPGVAETRGAPDAGIAVGGEPDRRARALERAHRDARAAQAEVAALVGDGLAAPQPLDDLEALDQTTDALLRVVPHCQVLDAAVPEADTEDQVAVRNHVERRELLGDLDRVVQREQENAGAECHAPGVGGEAREGRDRLEVRERIGEIVLARPDRAEPDCARKPDLLDVLAEAGRLRLLGEMLNGEAEAELHSGSLHTRPAAGSSVSVNWGSAMWSARSWKTTRTRLPIATSASDSAVKSTFTRLAIIRSASSGVGWPRCSSSSTSTTA